MAGKQPPSWLDEPCPAWCVREHHEDDHPEDRFHQSRAEVVDALAGGGDMPTSDLLHPTELVVRAGQHPGDPLVWLEVVAAEAAHVSIVLSAESGLALASAVATLSRSVLGRRH